MHRTPILIICLLMFVVGCSSAKEEGNHTGSVNAEGNPDSTNKRETEENTQAPAPEPTEQEKTGTTPMTLTFTGDVLFAWSLEQTVAEKGYEYPFQHVKEYFLQDDFTFVNFETPATERGTKEDKIYNFRTHPDAMDALANVGVDGVALANNHTLDFGIDGLLDTLHFADEAGLAAIGGGANESQAYQGYETTIQDKKVAFLNFSKVLPYIDWYAVGDRPGVASGYQMDRVIRIIEETKQTSDYVFVQIHWGKEKDTQFNESEQAYAHAMIDAGADGIIGSHPHVLQGFEIYKGKLIAYSLGNFLFPDYVKGETAQTGVLQLEIDENEELTYRFLPHFIKNDVIQPHPDANGLAQALEQRSAPGIKINEAFEITAQ
ncbi:poly-gamma-glutamate synthesis protein (capsule biosynthesis protein) [Thalassobacillus cyri]|uniref:Poly-gamma-glutamate synthesis protein (Capsule biosynthesis protein) n=1 Tax=Thalassobacillus cyri TaxID=571932 RepID=A0A1H4FRP9_9BACI|nr:CapA family protein [Thalassobacillus cyri]SEA99985.1 poly-gamma-glutamate synthesis protein (capsule biosynthesis protein) [Thalassobacillus cyri]